MRKQETIPALILFGPTASGKTAILEELFVKGALSRRLRAEIVSADSMQVYRGMDIGTAKPSPELRAALPHHLIDIRDPDEQFNVGEFVHLADRACAEIAARGKLPVISGGAGFYLRNFVLGLPATPPSDEAIRQELKEELRQRGIGALGAELAACDPQSAARIHINDEYRLLRALEVFRLTGQPLSAYSPSASPLPRNYRFSIIGLMRERADLYRRIDDRCAQMFRAGLPEEVDRLVAAGHGPEDPGMKAIGYREFFTQAGGRDLALIEALVARNSRRYAKRQLTFFAAISRSGLDVSWVPGDAALSGVLAVLRTSGWC
jgi:tRNA dimethylallyltransferase